MVRIKPRKAITAAVVDVIVCSCVLVYVYIILPLCLLVNGLECASPSVKALDGLLEPVGLLCALFDIGY
jgi:hypothetical protein